MDIALPGLAQFNDAALIYLGVKIVRLYNFLKGIKQPLVVLGSDIYQLRHILVVRKEVVEVVNRLDSLLTESRLNPATHTEQFQLVTKHTVLVGLHYTEPRGCEPQQVPVALDLVAEVNNSLICLINDDQSAFRHFNLLF